MKYRHFSLFLNLLLSWCQVALVIVLSTNVTNLKTDETELGSTLARHLLASASDVNQDSALWAGSNRWNRNIRVFYKKDNLSEA